MTATASSKTRRTKKVSTVDHVKALAARFPLATALLALLVVGHYVTTILGLAGEVDTAEVARLWVGRFSLGAPAVWAGYQLDLFGARSNLRRWMGR